MVGIEEAGAFALSRIFTFEPRAACTLADTLGSCAAIFLMDAKELSQTMGANIKYKEAISAVNLDRTASQLQQILDGKASFGYGGWGGECRYLTRFSPDYPPLLRECPDGPLGLFVWSCSSPADVFGQQECVSIVGTRDISPYGTSWCRKTVQALSSSRQRPTIVSGLAYGVDICAHRTALECDLPTIAVLGTGMWRIYPSAHEKDAREIVSREGCAIVSEFPPDAGVLPTNFLSRNRIIAGLSRSTLLVESKLRGGGMTTARQASSYNRDVFALPGRNDDLRSQGCNQLIQMRIAEPMTSCTDLFRALGYKAAAGGGNCIAAPANLKTFYGGSLDSHKIGWMHRIMGVVGKKGAAGIEDVAQQCGLPLRDVSYLCSLLEADGFLSIDILQRCSLKIN